MTYPSNYLRGLSNKDFIDGTEILASAFQFDENPNRSDQIWQEMSINWEDNETALDILINQTRADGSYQFRAGIARLKTLELNRIIERYQNLLDKERSPLSDNLYHGNILLQKKTGKPQKNKIAATLAMYADLVFDRRNEKASKEDKS